MDYRGVLLTGAVLGSGVLALSSGCNGPDPGAITFSERGGSIGEPQGSSSGTSGGATADAGGSSSGQTDDIFGASTFAYVDPGLTANNADPAHGGTVEGKDCIVPGCHLDNAKPWLMGGTIYSAATDGQVVPRAEVRIIGPDNTEVAQAYTDANGNFWFDKGDKTIPAGSKVGVRKEGGPTMRMATALNPDDGSCTSTKSNCHGTAAQGKVYAQ